MVKTWFSGGFDMKVSAEVAEPGKSRNENNRKVTIKLVDKVRRACLAGPDNSTFLIDV